ncbi:MAG TPA: mannose-1-phosphate guanylyltransferase [Candidatus Limnocylindrales bacterium]|nr:mannose-1-phosphate guanylyltransferase [Candidatus Limnocylindrales bacterium]
MPDKQLSIHAVILAGGRGTRFWPRSRTRTPKQLLNIIGKTTMLQQTVARLRPLIAPDRIWTVTNAEQIFPVRKQLPLPARKRVLTEPLGRNTTAAIALAAVHVRHAAKDDALLAVLPADHHIDQPERYRQIVATALKVAKEKGRMVVLGIPPSRPETGFGYIERIGEPRAVSGFPVFAVQRFTEKPELAAAKEYLASGNYFWNAGMFFWRVSTFMEALKAFLPKTYEAIENLSARIGKSSYASQLKKIYPRLENISVDYAVLEKAASGRQNLVNEVGNVSVIPADFGWSDIGSWTAVYELLAKRAGENILAGPGQTLDAEGNFLWSPGKFVAAIGVRDLVIVETNDALLICPRDRAQDVSKVVKSLEERKLKKLL